MAPPGGPDRACSSPAALAGEGPPAFASAFGRTTTPSAPRGGMRHNAPEPRCPLLLRHGRCSREEGCCKQHLPVAFSIQVKKMRNKEGKNCRKETSWIQIQQVNYKQISEDVSKKMQSYITDTSGWKQVKKGKLATVSARPSTDYPGDIYRVEATMEQPAEKVFPFLYLLEHRGKWDKSLQSYRIIDTIDENTSVYQSVTHSYGFGLVPPRDFVYIVHIKKYDSVLTTNSISVDHPNCPPCRPYIRGKTYPSCYACYPLPENPGHCKVVAIIQVDLGGFLLPSVVQTVMPTSLLNMITDCRAGLKALK